MLTPHERTSEDATKGTSHPAEEAVNRKETEKKRALRANILFDYIEKKEIEVKKEKLALLKEIVAKQRLKIEAKAKELEMKQKKLVIQRKAALAKPVFLS